MPRSRIARSYGYSIFCIEGISILFSIVVSTIYIPTNIVGSFPFLHTLSSFFFFFFFCFYVFFRAEPVVPMEIPRLEVQSELLLLAYARAKQHQTGAMSMTYTTAHGSARSLTHWARPGIEPTVSWFLVRFISAAPWQELL